MIGASRGRNEVRRLRAAPAPPPMSELPSITLKIHPRATNRYSHPVGFGPHEAHVMARVRQHVISHIVSTSTAPTQASSTMQALVTLGVCKTNGAGKNPTHAALDAPVARKLEKMTAMAG